MQTVVYFRTYFDDSLRNKFMVSSMLSAFLFKRQADNFCDQVALVWLVSL